MENEIEKYLNRVKRDGMLLKYVPEEFQTDESIDIAMDNSIFNFQWIKDESKKTYERCLKAVRGHWWLILYVPAEFRERVIKDKDIGNNL